MNPPILTRREALQAAVAAGLAFSPALSALAADARRPFKIGACDWSIKQRGQLKALQLAHEFGLDGVQVSFDQPGSPYDLRLEKNRRLYLQAAKQYDVEIASLAMGVLNHVPYASSPEAEQWVEQCIETMPKMQQKIVLLAFFGQGDIKDQPERIQEVIRRLKKVAPQAERAGVILGLETQLNADGHLRILDAVGSPAVQVYYDVANMQEQGYDIYQEIRQLGQKRICQFHFKENNSLLGKGLIDFHRVKDAVDAIGYRGWLVIESALGKGMSIRDSYVANQKYLRSIFPTGA